jgi:hypothetical protein
MKKTMRKRFRAVYLLQHVARSGRHDEDVKTLGIFSSRREATLAIRRVEKLAGFKRYREGFHVDRYRLNERAWTEGFVTVGSSS